MDIPVMITIFGKRNISVKTTVNAKEYRFLLDLEYKFFEVTQLSRSPIVIEVEKVWSAELTELKPVK